jgi:hypothetical protein
MDSDVVDEDGELTEESTDEDSSGDNNGTTGTDEEQNEENGQSLTKNDDEKSNVAMWLMIAVTVVGLLVLGLFIWIIRRGRS